MAGNKGEVTYEIRADDSKVERDIDQANKKVENAAKKSSDSVVKVEENKTKKLKTESDKTVKSAEKAADNVSDAWKDAGKDAEKAMSDIKVEDVDIDVKADTSDARKNIESLKASDLQINVDADTGKAESDIDLVSRDKDIEVNVEADTGKAESDIDQVSRDKAIEINVDADTGKAESAIKSISKDKSIDVDVKADASKAESEIAGLADTADDVGGKIEQSLSGALGNVANLAKTSFADAATSTVPFLGNVGTLTEGLSGASVAALGIGAAAVGTSVLAVGAADDMRGAMNQFAAETGKSREEMERYQGVLEDVYANNYGESFDDIAGAMAQVTKNLGDMSDESLQSVTESAFALQDVSKGALDIEGSTRAAKAMMDNFGTSGEKAMELISAGYVDNLDYSGEMLDSISEYSVQFAKVGLDADDMFTIFKKGADTGAWNLDKIGDAVKEMSIRVIDGSETTKAGFEGIGLNADKMAAKFAAGGDTAKEAFNQTIAGLASMEDPIAQNTAGVNLFGTMWEDLGPEVVSQLADIGDSAYTTGKELNSMKEIKYDDLGSMFEELKRNVELLLLPLGEALMPILMELIQAVLPILKDLLVPLIQLLGEIIEPILSLVSGAFGPLIEAFMSLINMALIPLMELLENVFIPLFKFVFDVILAVVDGQIGKVTAVLENLGEFIENVFTGNWKGAWENIKNIFSIVFGDGVFSTADHVQAIFENVIDFIKNVFTGNWRGAWENIKNIFSNAVGALEDIFKAPLNAIVDGWNSLSSKLGNIKVPKWVPLAGGKSFNLPTLPRLKVGMDYVPSDDFPALLHRGEAVLTAEENKKLKAFGGVDGIEKVMSDMGKKVPDNLRTIESISASINQGRSNDRPIHIEIPLNVDGREIARASAECMGEQLSWEEL